MNFIREKRYVCVGCEQDVETIGGYMHIDPTPPPPLPPAVRVCKPCGSRIDQSVGFRKAVEARVMQYAQREVIEQATHMPLVSAQERSISIARDTKVQYPEWVCEVLDDLFMLPRGTHFAEQNQPAASASTASP